MADKKRKRAAIQADFKRLLRRTDIYWGKEQ